MGNLLKALAVALLLPVTVVCTALTIYFGNSSELGIDLLSVLKISLAFFVFATVVLVAVQLPFLYFFKGKAFAFVNAVILSAGYWFWLQANVLNWDMGPLTGVIPFGQYKPYAYLELGIWFIAAILTVIFFKFLFKYSVQFACILAVTQVFCLIPLCFQEAQTARQLKSNFAEYEYTFNHLFDYSQDKDVYVFVLDAFGSVLFDKIATEFSCNEKFKDFTYFPKQFVYYPAATKWSLPRILSGLDARDDRYNYVIDNNNTPEQKTFFHAAFSEKTLFDDAAGNGYECRVYSWYPLSLYWNPQSIANIKTLEQSPIGTPLWTLRASRFAGLTLFRLLPLRFKYMFYWKGLLEGNFRGMRELRKDILDGEYVPLFLGTSDIHFSERIQSIQWDFTPQHKQFKFIHLASVHGYFAVNEFMDGHSELLVHFDAKEQDELQCESLLAMRTLKIVLSILDTMKEKGNYDNSLIVIMSDHGIQNYSYLETHPTAKNKPLLLVKRPLDKHDVMQRNDNPVCISDTRNAILAELDLPRPDDAFSWFDVPADLTEKRNAEWSAYLDYINERAQKP